MHSSSVRYTSTARAAAAEVITRYSTSFSLATRTLPAHVRAHICAIYAMVRVADEIVDGATSAPPAELLAELDAFADRVEAAYASGFSSDLVVHAFAHTARTTGITPEVWAPFFASMRSDVALASDADSEAGSEAGLRTFTQAEFRSYIHGSAEVIGEMCVRAFLSSPGEEERELGALGSSRATDRDGTDPAASTPAEAGAPGGPEPLDPAIRTGAHALGAAFQKVNFLRDRAHDTADLHRSYFPGVTVLGEDDKRRIVADIRADLAIAEGAIGLLPRAVRPAVLTAHGLFAALTDELARTPASVIETTRVRVPNRRKITIAAAAWTKGLRSPGSGRAADVAGAGEPRGSGRRAPEVRA